MKKLLSLFLLSFILLTSCADIGSNAGGGTTEPEITTEPETTNAHEAPESTSEENEIVMNVASHVISSDCLPYWHDVDPTWRSPWEVKEVVLHAPYEESVGAEREEELYNALNAYEFDLRVKYRSILYETKEAVYVDYIAPKACIIDNEGFEEYFDALVSNDYSYSEYFSDDFFENNFVLFVQLHESTFSYFLGFEYEFDPATKALKLNMFERNHEGWHYCTHAIGHTFYYYIAISKEDITIDGKIVPYEELNIDMSGVLVFYG